MDRYLRRVAGCVLVSATLSAGLVGASGPTYGAARPSSVSFLVAARHALVGLRFGLLRPKTHGGTSGVDQKQVALGNWSGYVADNSTGNTYTEVSASWKQPEVAMCVNDNDQEGIFFSVGLDGFKSPTAEAAGILVYCNNGTVTYQEFWVMTSLNRIKLLNKVAAGDEITASVEDVQGKYTLAVTDSSPGGMSFKQKGEICGGGCKNASADWIAVRYGGPNGLIIPDFITWTPDNAKATTGAGLRGHIAAFPWDAITMVNGNNQELITVSPLNKVMNKVVGSRFTAMWQQSS